MLRYISANTTVITVGNNSHKGTHVREPWAPIIQTTL